MQAVYGGVVFLAAFLLFVVEPMAAKQLLPILGGSSEVWVHCLVFFQAVLLAGYAYAHWMAQRNRLLPHFALLACAALTLMLPWLSGAIGRATHVESNLVWSTAHPVLTIFAALGLSIGLPFLALASTTPLAQVWWAQQTRGVVPYRMYALSNAGSLLALLAYPTLIEPHITLSLQRGLWAAGFVVFAAMSAWLAHRANAAPAIASSTVAAEIDPIRESESETKDAAEPISRRRRWLWFLLPMGAAMQLAAVTSHLSQDIAPVPLLWILPLAAYLITFIVAFEMPGLYRRWVLIRLLAVMLASLGYALSKLDTRLPLGLAILFYLAELFVACWFCHAEAYRLRPSSARESTRFYLLIAAGGVAGTFLIAIASPMIFRANYDLAISFLVTALLAALVTWNEGWAQRLLWVTGSVLLMLLIGALNLQFNRHALMRARNFYGSLRVVQVDFDDSSVGDASGWSGAGPIRTLMNGRIRHGMQVMNEQMRETPTTYYGSDTGIGIAMKYCCERRTKRVGVIGLGAGTLAAYGQPGDVFRFYEINPLVGPIARNLFTYLRDSKAAIEITEGDGRAELSREPDQRFDVLVVDAFTGDAIPLHLLTREAMDVYRRQLAPGGVIAFHVSNSYLDLTPEIALLADSAGMQARVVTNDAVPAEGEFHATWVLVSADAGFFARPGVENTAARITRQPGLRLWTDDYSSLLPVLKLNR